MDFGGEGVVFGSGEYRWLGGRDVAEEVDKAADRGCSGTRGRLACAAVIMIGVFLKPKSRHARHRSTRDDVNKSKEGETDASYVGQHNMFTLLTLVFGELRARGTCRETAGGKGGKNKYQGMLCARLALGRQLDE